MAEPLVYKPVGVEPGKLSTPVPSHPPTRRDPIVLQRPRPNIPQVDGQRDLRSEIVRHQRRADPGVRQPDAWHRIHPGMVLMAHTVALDLARKPQPIPDQAPTGLQTDAIDPPQHGG